jgi:hypothetical protein
MPNRNGRAIPNVPVRTQRFFAYCFEGFVSFDTFRFKHPIWFSLIAGSLVAVAVGVLTTFIPLDRIDWWVARGWFFPGNVVRAGVSLTAGIFLTQPIARGLLPMLTIVPQAIAMKNLGLLFVTTNHTECARLFLKASSEHSKGEKVKVICISGRYLFRELRLPGDDGIPLPLHELAKNGQLEVIMPASDPGNPTIRGRYATYSREFLLANGIVSCSFQKRNSVCEQKRNGSEHGAMEQDAGFGFWIGSVA